MDLQQDHNSAWVEHQLDTGLWVFLAGAEAGELRFRWLFVPSKDVFSEPPPIGGEVEVRFVTPQGEVGTFGKGLA